MKKVPPRVVQFILYQKQKDFARLFPKISTQKRIIGETSAYGVLLLVLSSSILVIAWTPER